MQDAFDGLVSRLDTADKRIWAQACYQQNSQTRKQENKDWKKKKKAIISKDMGHLQGYDIHIMGISEGERNRRHIWNNNDWEFPQIIKHQ